VLNLFQHNALLLVILKQVQDDDVGYIFLELKPRSRNQRRG
jgi:hypothetical protein